MAVTGVVIAAAMAIAVMVVVVVAAGQHPLHAQPEGTVWVRQPLLAQHRPLTRIRWGRQLGAVGRLPVSVSPGPPSALSKRRRGFNRPRLQR